MKRCYKCGGLWAGGKRQPGVKECCEACSAYLHSCMNCRFRDKKLHNQCRIPNTEWVGDRAGANFCDEFDFADSESYSAEASEHEEARQAFGALFGGGDDAEPRPARSLDDLLGGGKH